jgi:hypothetical protein
MGVVAVSNDDRAVVENWFFSVESRAGPRSVRNPLRLLIMLTKY